MFFHTTPSNARSGRAGSIRVLAAGTVAAPGAGTGQTVHPPADRAADRMIDGAAGDPWGRRVIFLHPGKGAWWRLLDHVPPGQEWVTVPAAGAPPHALAQTLATLLTDRAGRKPVLVAGAVTAVLAIAAALDHPDRVGGVMIIDDVGAESPLRHRWNLLKSCFGTVAPDGLPKGLDSLDVELPAVQVPVTLMQGADPLGLFGRLEAGLTGCRTLTVVAVRDAVAVRPRTHAAELRGALAALIAAVERARG